MKQVLSGAMMAIVLCAATPAPNDVTLPPPERLITMSIEERLAMYNAMAALPPNQRDANLKALRQEIDSLTPEQKQQMSANFKAEYQTLPAEQQEILRQQLKGLSDAPQQ